MSRKQNILNKIKSIKDPELLQELEQWLDEVYNTESGRVKEEYQAYTTKKASSKNREKSVASRDAFKWLQKIADSGGVTGIDNAVEWQKKERRDRSLPIQ